MPSDASIPNPGGGMAGQSANATTSFGASSILSVPSVGMVGGASGSAAGFKTGVKRATFAADELAIVLSHYDIGTLEAVQEFARGSRRAPKALIRSERGVYLLKRRARGKDDPFKVAFCHALQLYLASQQFPLPHLIGTRKDNNSMLQCKGSIYELFEYIKGTGYDSSLAATAEAGRTLALFHRLLHDYETQYEAPVGSYHGSRSVGSAMEIIPSALIKINPQHVAAHAERMQELIGFLQTSYEAAAAQVDAMGLTDWPAQIVHADWHPGNMLFRGEKAVAVIDYDAARVQQRVLDVANGALQFSILAGGDDPATWPQYIDESRFKRFLRGYDAVPNCVLSRAELRATVWLMIEALIAECVIPIAATGSFARLEGIGFLAMVERKVRWLQDHAQRLTQVIEG